jgi:hypothetical protein
VDGTDFKAQEPYPFNRKWMSHKYKGAALKYEVAISIFSGDIVWIYGPVHLSVKRTPEFQGHMTPQNDARKTRSFKIRKRRIAHSFPLTAFKIIISIIFMQYNTTVKCLTNIKGKEHCLSVK